jgi:hypothetical protein
MPSVISSVMALSFVATLEQNVGWCDTFYLVDSPRGSMVARITHIHPKNPRNNFSRTELLITLCGITVLI